MLNKKVAGDQAERRKSVRANDAVGLCIHRLTELPAAGQPPVTGGVSSVRKSDKYSIAGYADVRRDHPAVAQYISDLEERIRELLLDNDEALSKSTHKISLSLGGMRFSDKSLFVPGEVVSLVLTLFPSGQRIGTDAVIVSANDTDESTCHDRPSYRAEFLRMSDHDRGVIETHIDQLLTKRKLLDY